uniref:CSON011824 protein n=1 Tax=Culicoides sonorensis TaxID=179676 RepID=A0A336LMA1_CULSO
MKYLVKYDTNVFLSVKMNCNQIYHSFIMLRSVQIYSIFASIGIILVYSSILSDLIWNFGYSLTIPTVLGLAYSGCYLIFSVIAIQGAINRFKKLLVPQMIFSVIYIILFPFSLLFAISLQNLDMTFLIHFASIVPVIALYCEIARDEYEGSQIPIDVTVKVDSPHDLNYSKLPKDVKNNGCQKILSTNDIDETFSDLQVMNRAIFYSDTIGLVFSIFYVMISILAIRGVVKRVKHCLVPQMMCGFIYVILSPFMNLDSISLRNLDTTLIINFISLVPIFVLFCEIASKESE